MPPTSSFSRSWRWLMGPCLPLLIGCVLATAPRWARAAPATATTDPDAGTPAPAATPEPATAKTPPPAAPNRPSPAAPAAAAPAAKRRVEIGVIPLVGGDTDVGFGVGELSEIAGLPSTAKGVPYRWALDSSAFISFKPNAQASGHVIIPYQDYYIQWIAPQLMGGRLRLEARPSFTRESTQRYYGLGNASPAPAVDVPARDFYGRTHPMLWARARYRFWDYLHAGLGVYYTHNWLNIPADSTLAQQMRDGDATVRRLLGASASHGVLILETLARYDTRDNEINTTAGQYHQVKLRISPRLADVIPYSYQQINVTSGFFHTVLPDRLVLAGRVVADVQLGDPPFYELARYDDTYALGGVNGVRGVPGQRYYGKVKVFANGEARSRLVGFNLFSKHMTLGLAAFFDVGRAWAELASNPALDGQGWGLKYGVGGGIRLQQGNTFVVRGDLAWSPDARPIGAYVNAGQMF